MRCRIGETERAAFCFRLGGFALLNLFQPFNRVLCWHGGRGSCRAVGCLYLDNKQP